MASSKDELKAEIKVLLGKVNTILSLINQIDKSNDSGSHFVKFQTEYQQWYTPALRLLARLAPDRLAEFKSYYEIDPKRKALLSSTYVIQDYMRGTLLHEVQGGESASYRVMTYRVVSQSAILKSLYTRIDGILANVEAAVLADLQDAELRTATQLKKLSLRAAGALAGVVLEAHLQRVAANHSVRIAKKDPTIGDLNDPLKNAGVYDTAPWRKIQHLGDIRNLCSHRKDREPKEDEISEMIDGVSWAIKTIA